MSYHDTSEESFYQGLVLGLCALIDDHYQIRSNWESGDGRFDIQLMPKTGYSPGILIELKSAGKNEHINLKALAETALKPIEDKKYDTEVRAEGITDIVKYGIAFCGKEVEILSV